MLKEIDFIDLLAKEVFKKRLWQGISAGLLLLLLVLAVKNALEPKKTLEDMAKEYATCRLSFTPETVDRAYLQCPYQEKFTGIEAVTLGERNSIKSQRLYSLFYPESVRFVGNEVLVDGLRIVSGSEPQKATAVLEYTGRGFILKRVQ